MFDEIIEKMEQKRNADKKMSEFLEDMMIECGPPDMKAAFMLGKEIRLMAADLRRLLHYVEEPYAEQVYKDAYEYVRLAHEGLRTFIDAHTEKYGKDVVDEPV